MLKLYYCRREGKLFMIDCPQYIASRLGEEYKILFS
jgi:hypothetical protein